MNENDEMNEINESENDEILFKDLGLDEKTLRAVELKGFKIPSPIQILAIPRLLSGDANLIAKARTGTGKTAAFGLPLVQKITEKKDIPQALVLTPTRELCLQVCKEIESFATSSFPRMVACYGGQGMTEQIRSLKRGSEISLLRYERIFSEREIQDHYLHFRACVRYNDLRRYCGRQYNIPEKSARDRRAALCFRGKSCQRLGGGYYRHPRECPAVQGGERKAQRDAHRNVRRDNRQGKDRCRQ